MRKNLWLSENASCFQRKANGSSFLSVAEEATLSEKCVPRNTATNTKWAVANFEGWRNRRNETFHLQPKRQVPDDLLLGHDSAALCKWLSVYVAEAKKQDGSPFPPKSLYMLLAGILRHMRSKNPLFPNFLHNKQLEFAMLWVMCFESFVWKAFKVIV